MSVEEERSFSEEEYEENEENSQGEKNKYEDSKDNERPVKKLRFVYETEEERQEREKQLRELQESLKGFHRIGRARDSPDVIELSDDSNSYFEETYDPPNSVKVEVKEEADTEDEQDIDWYYVETECDDRSDGKTNHTIRNQTNVKNNENIRDNYNDLDDDNLYRRYATDQRTANLHQEYEQDPLQQVINQQLRENNEQQYNFAKRILEQGENQQVPQMFLNEGRRIRKQRRNFYSDMQQIHPHTFMNPTESVNFIDNEEQHIGNQNNYYLRPVNTPFAKYRNPQQKAPPIINYGREHFPFNNYEPNNFDLTHEIYDGNPMYCNREFPNTSFLQSARTHPRFMDKNETSPQSETSFPTFNYKNDHLQHPQYPGHMRVGRNHLLQVPVNSNFNNGFVDPTVVQPNLISHPISGMENNYQSVFPNEPHFLTNNVPINPKQFRNNNIFFCGTDLRNGQNNFEAYNHSHLNRPAMWNKNDTRNQGNYEVPHNICQENTNEFYIANNQEANFQNMHLPQYSSKRDARNFDTDFQPAFQRGVYQNISDHEKNMKQNFQPIYEDNIHQNFHSMQKSEFKNNPVFGKNSRQNFQPVNQQNVKKHTEPVNRREKEQNFQPIYEDNVHQNFHSMQKSEYKNNPAHGKNNQEKFQPSYQRNVKKHTEPVNQEEKEQNFQPIYKDNVHQNFHSMQKSEYKNSPAHEENNQQNFQPAYQRNVKNHTEPVNRREKEQNFQPIYEDNVHQNFHSMQKSKYKNNPTRERNNQQNFHPAYQRNVKNNTESVNRREKEQNFQLIYEDNIHQNFHSMRNSEYKNIPSAEKNNQQKLASQCNVKEHIKPANHEEKQQIFQPIYKDNVHKNFYSIQKSEYKNNPAYEKSSLQYFQPASQCNVKEHIEPANHGEKQPNIQPIHEDNVHKNFHSIQNLTCKNFVHYSQLNEKNRRVDLKTDHPNLQHPVHSSTSQLSQKTPNDPKTTENVNMDEHITSFQPSYQNTHNNKQARKETDSRNKQNVFKHPYQTRSNILRSNTRTESKNAKQRSKSTANTVRNETKNTVSALDQSEVTISKVPVSSASAAVAGVSKITPTSPSKVNALSGSADACSDISCFTKTRANVQKTNKASRSKNNSSKNSTFKKYSDCPESSGSSGMTSNHDTAINTRETPPVCAVPVTMKSKVFIQAVMKTKKGKPKFRSPTPELSSMSGSGSRQGIGTFLVEEPKRVSNRKKNNRMCDC